MRYGIDDRSFFRDDPVIVQIARAGSKGIRVRLGLPRMAPQISAKFWRSLRAYAECAHEAVFAWMHFPTVQNCGCREAMYMGVCLWKLGVQIESYGHN